MEHQDGAQYTSGFIVEPFGGHGFTWEIVTWERRTSAMVGTKRSEVRYETREEARDAGEAALNDFVLPAK